MLPPELFDYDSVEPELVLDLAASPGGKTTHLVDKLGDRGLVIANDASRSRIQALRLALERWGAINIAVTCQPGELFGAWYPGVFDKVLIDAPCSMEGLRTAESHPMRPVTGRERESLSSRQVRLLTGALKAVRVGGQVVYSTCTLAPEEDEAVLLAIKQRLRFSGGDPDAQAGDGSPCFANIRIRGLSGYHTRVTHLAAFVQFSWIFHSPDTQECSL